MPRTTELTALVQLGELVRTLHTEIHELAEAGNTLACDARHAWIANVETTMALLEGAREDDLG